METAIEVTDLVINRGKREVLHGFSCTIPRGSITGLLGPSGSGKTTLMRAVVGVQVVASGRVTVLGRAGGHAAAAAQDRLSDPGPQRLRRPHGPGERPLLRVALRSRRGRRRRRPGERRAGRRRAAARRQPLRRSAQPRLAGLRARRPARGAGARRADRRPGPGAARRAVGAVPRPGRRRRHDPRLQPRDGRGQPLRPAAADPRRRPDRRRHPGGDQGAPPAPTTSTRRSCASSGRQEKAAASMSSTTSSPARPAGSCASSATTAAPSR